MRLWCVTLHALRITWRNGSPEVKQGVCVGPLAAATGAEVEEYARAAVRQQFPATKDWSEHGFTFCAVPDGLVRQTASALEAAQGPELPRKQRRKEREANG